MTPRFPERGPAGWWLVPVPSFRSCVVGLLIGQHQLLERPITHSVVRSLAPRMAGLEEETLVTSSNPCLPGSVVGECSMELKVTERKLRRYMFGNCTLVTNPQEGNLGVLASPAVWSGKIHSSFPRAGSFLFSSSGQSR